MFGGGPRFDGLSDTSSPTLDFNGEQLAAQLEKLEALADTTGGNRLPPEEMMTTKAHAPSGELLARARGEREREAARRTMPNTPEEAPSRDTIPPPDEYDDRTMVGSTGQPPSPLGAQAGPTLPEWEDETTPVGDEHHRRHRR
jgi:hypothetical protein